MERVTETDLVTGFTPALKLSGQHDLVTFKGPFDARDTK